MGVLDPTPPRCPLCNALLVVRRANAGPNAGGEFLGCSRFPDCRGTRAIPAPDADRAPLPEDCVTVSRFNRIVRGSLGATFRGMWITGELGSISDRDGHLFGSIRDESAQLEIVMWRDAANSLAFRLEPGLHVLIHGSADFNARGGRFRFSVDRVLPEGEGALELAFKQLHARLAREGLFERSRKRPLPRFPMRVGIVTSRAGAALQDIRVLFRERTPHVSICLAPTIVQGPSAAVSIVAALGLIFKEDVDLIILGRGGGASEDLAAFNDEAVVRAIVTSPVPVISAVGHETDTTLSDLAADVRAPTPSAAAELASPATPTIEQLLDQRVGAITSVLHRRLEQRTSGHASLSVRLFAAQRRGVAEYGRRLDQLSARHNAATRGRVTETGIGLARLLGAFVRIPKSVEVKAIRLGAIAPRLSAAVNGRVNECRLGLDRWRRYDFSSAEMRVRSAARALLADDRRLSRETALAMDRKRLRLERASAVFAAVSPENVLRRGYALVRVEDGSVVRDAGDLRPADLIKITFAVGAAEAEVTKTSEEGLT